MRHCPLCDEAGSVEDGIKIAEAKFKSADTHLLWMPELHISQADMMDERAYIELIDHLVKYGKTFDGYQMVMNVGKYCSQPQHAHIHLLRHDGPHKSGNKSGICEQCKKYQRAHYV